MVPVSSGTPARNLTEALGTLNEVGSGELHLRKAEAPVRMGALTGRHTGAAPSKGFAVSTLITEDGFSGELHLRKAEEGLMVAPPDRFMVAPPRKGLVVGTGELHLRTAEAPVRLGALTGRVMVAPPKKGLDVGTLITDDALTGNASVGTDLVIVFGRGIDEEHQLVSTGTPDLTNALGV